MRISDWSSYVCSSDLRGNLRRTLENLNAMIEGEEMSSSGGRGFNPITLVSQAAETARVAVTSGLARTSRPDKPVRALASFVRLGTTPAAGTRKSVLEGKVVAVRVSIGGRRPTK